MRIDVRGFEMGYEDTGGAGVPLILIHGFPLDRTIWSAQVSGLSDVARVIAPDLRGFGESSMAGGAMTIDDYATDVRALMDALGLAKAVIGGVSMGGYVAMAFQRKFPSRVEGLVFVDTRGDADTLEGKAGRDASIATARAEGVAAIAAQMLPKMLTPAASEPKRRALSDMMNRQTLEGVVGALAALRDRGSSTSSNAGIRVPALVVCGAEDAIIAPKEAEALRATIPGARLVVIPGAGHLPNYETPDAFNAAVRELLATIPVRRQAASAAA